MSAGAAIALWIAGKISRHEKAWQYWGSSIKGAFHELGSILFAPNMEPMESAPEKSFHPLDSVKAIWPVCLAYFPLGLAFGVLAQKTGLSGLEIFFMSLLVFAGSGQFVAVSMLGAGASIFAIVFTTFMVNLRHLLMGSSLAVWYRGAPRGPLSLLACFIVDETFAVNTMRLKQGAWPIENAIFASFLAYSAWVVSTVAGGLLGPLIPPSAFGIDYAMIAMLIGLLVFQLKNLMDLVTALFAALAGTLTALFIPGNAFIIVGAILGATAGLAVKHFRMRLSEKRGLP